MVGRGKGGGCPGPGVRVCIIASKAREVGLSSMGLLSSPAFLSAFFFLRCHAGFPLPPPLLPRSQDNTLNFFF